MLSCQENAYNKTKSKVLELIQKGITFDDLLNRLNFREIPDAKYKYIFAALEELEKTNKIVCIKYYTGSVRSFFCVPKGTEFIFNNICAYSE